MTDRYTKGSSVLHRGVTGVIAPEAFVTDKGELYQNEMKDRLDRAHKSDVNYYPLRDPNQLTVRQGDCLFAYRSEERSRAHTALQSVQKKVFSSFNGLDPNTDEVVFYGTALTDVPFSQENNQYVALTKAGPVSYDFKGREDICPGDMVIWDWPGRDIQHGTAVPVTRIIRDIPGRFTAEFYPFKFTDIALEFAIIQDIVLGLIQQAKPSVAPDHDRNNAKPAWNGQYMYDLSASEQASVITSLRAFDFGPFSLYRSQELREKFCPIRKYAYFFARAMGCDTIKLDMYDLSVKVDKSHRNSACKPDAYILDLISNAKHGECVNFLDFMERSPLYVIEQVNLYRSRIIGRCQQTNGRGNQLNIVTGYV
jgi:hypothetical protein